jgi:large subunit ribosomal protein L29
MNIKDLREKTVQELRDEEKRIQGELFENKFRHGTRQLNDTASLSTSRKDIARVKTVIQEKEAEAARND